MRSLWWYLAIFVGLAAANTEMAVMRAGVCECSDCPTEYRSGANQGGLWSQPAHTSAMEGVATTMPGAVMSVNYDTQMYERDPLVVRPSFYPTRLWFAPELESTVALVAATPCSSSQLTFKKFLTASRYQLRVSYPANVSMKHSC